MNYLKKILGLKNTGAKIVENVSEITMGPVQVDAVATNLLMDVTSGKFDLTDPSKEQDQMRNKTKDQVSQLDSNETKNHSEDQEMIIVPEHFTSNETTSSDQIKIANEQAKLEVLNFEDEFKLFITKKQDSEIPKASEISGDIIKRDLDNEATKEIEEIIELSEASTSFTVENEIVDTSDFKITTSEILCISSDDDEPSQMVADDEQSPIVADNEQSRIVADDEQSRIVADDEQSPIVADVDQEVPSDNDSSGYISSDFEFITQSEAELEGLVIKYNKTMKNEVKKVSTVKTVEICRIDNPRVDPRQNYESIQTRNMAGPSNFQPKPTAKEILIEPTNRDENVGAYAFLEGNYDPLPHNNYFLEQKSLSFNTISRMQTEDGVGFDIYAFNNRRNVAPIDEQTQREAESTKELILSMYPQKRPK